MARIFIRFFKKFVSPDVMRCLLDDLFTIKFCDPYKHEEEFNKKREVIKFVKAFIDSSFKPGKYLPCPDMNDERLIVHKVFTITSP